MRQGGKRCIATARQPPAVPSAGLEIASGFKDVTRAKIRLRASVYCDNRRDHCNRAAKAPAAFQ
jgi:hypothetical protein